VSLGTFKDGYELKRFRLGTDFGAIWIDFFDVPDTKAPFTKGIVLVFPVLGGKSLIENYFADYLARQGIETAIIHRSDEFRNPNSFENIERVFQHNVIRDRIAMDFLENRFGKSEFGSFGISRGAINVTMSAGVDTRLKYNVLVVGGTDMSNLFRESDQRGIKKYIEAVISSRDITREEFFVRLTRNLKTDPKGLAQYLDARDTLLILARYDKTVPFKYGRALRRQIGKPKTLYLFADHYTALLFTRILKAMPLGVIERAAVNFYREKFSNKCQQSPP
jgi:hypothetical protein